MIETILSAIQGFLDNIWTLFQWNVGWLVKTVDYFIQVVNTFFDYFQRLVLKIQEVETVFSYWVTQLPEYFRSGLVVVVTISLIYMLFNR